MVNDFNQVNRFLAVLVQWGFEFQVLSNLYQKLAIQH